MIFEEWWERAYGKLNMANTLFKLETMKVVAESAWYHGQEEIKEKIYQFIKENGSTGSDKEHP